MSAQQNSSMPLFVSLGLIVAGLIIGLIGGIGSGSLIGGLVAAFGLLPACYAAWLGVQKEGQGTLLGAILLIFGSLGVGGLLLILWLVAKVF